MRPRARRKDQGSQLKSVEGEGRPVKSRPLKGAGGGGDSLAVKYGVKGSIIDYTDFLCRKKP